MLLDIDSLDIFLLEKSDIVINSAILTTFPNKNITENSDNFQLYLDRLVEPYLIEEDTLLTEHILDYPYYYNYMSAPDSIKFNVKRYIQRLITQEYDYNRLIINTSGHGNNFDYFYFYNDSIKPYRLEILYTE